jgi:hypothetical protein
MGDQVSSGGHKRYIKIMTIRRLTASADNTISNAFKDNLSDRATSANMGESDILEMFSIYAQSNESSVEKSRILIKFPINELKKLQDDLLIPTTGVKYYLRLYNARHNQTVPEKYDLSVLPVVKDWEEGYGLDMESYLNEGPSNWLQSATSVSWNSEGGDYFDDSNIVSNLSLLKHYVTGAADNIEKDITTYVEEWLKDATGTSVAASLALTITTSDSFPADSTIKILSTDAQAKTYKFVSSQSAFAGDNNLNSSGEVEVRLGTNSVKIKVATATEYQGAPNQVTVYDGANTVNFKGQAAVPGAFKIDASNYVWHAGVDNVSTLASALYAAIANAITLEDLTAAATDPAGASDTVVVHQVADSSVKITSSNTNDYEIVSEMAVTAINFKAGVEAAIGHNGKITCAVASPTAATRIVTLTQATKGLAGNTKITKSAGLAAPVVTSGVDNFTLGTGLVNYGLGVFLSGSYEDGTKSRSFYTKKFFARGTEYWFSRPVIEAQWDSTLGDDRVRLVTANPHIAESDNKHSVYYYNYINGVLKDFPGDQGLAANRPKFTLTSDTALSQKVTIRTGLDPERANDAAGEEIQSVKVSTGVYEASFKINNSITATTLYEKWWIGVEATAADLLRGHAGSSSLPVYKWYEEGAPDTSHASDRYVANIINLKHLYDSDENIRFRVFIRNKNQSQNLYTVVKSTLSAQPLKKAYYQIKRIADDLTIIPYSTGSVNYSGLSYDKDGNYFDLDLSLLQGDQMYEISFMCDINGQLKELADKFKFRVD